MPEQTPDHQRRRLPRKVIATLAVLVAAVVAVVVLTNRGGSGAVTPRQVPHADASVPGTPLTVGVDTCAAQWHGGSAGRLTFALWNNSIQGVTVYLQDTSTSKVHLEVEDLGPGATRSASLTLPAGNYRFMCIPGEADPLTSEVKRVSGTTTLTTTPGVVAVTNNELEPALARYLRWIRGQLPALLADVQALDRDVRRGDLAAARVTWLRGHMRYETLGAAYGVFGDDDTDINALPSTTVPARRDRDLHGFHRIEALLWSGASASAIAPETKRLVTSVEHLRRDLRTPSMDTVDIGLRAHEILENSIEFELSGRSDAGSHTTLATVAANIVGTRRALAPIRHLLLLRDPELTRTYAWLRRTKRYVDSFHHGRWRALQSLDRAQRERLDADMSECLELLSRVAVITDPRRVATP